MLNERKKVVYETVQREHKMQVHNSEHKEDMHDFWLPP
jgi:hypothetical protein